MKSNGRKFQKNNAAFTGLEAAIVLIAFVVVAAVFSYVMLGAGFFTSQKSKEVVHTGVDQATSSIELAGDIIGIGDTNVTANATSGNKLVGVKLTLGLTAGNNPVDLSKMAISYKTKTAYIANIFNPYAAGTTTINNVDWDESPVVTWTAESGTSNTLLEQYEKVTLYLDFSDTDNGFAAAHANLVGPNGKITLELKPATGATLPVSVTVPPAIKTVMTLV